MSCGAPRSRSRVGELAQRCATHDVLAVTHREGPRSVAAVGPRIHEDFGGTARSPVVGPYLAKAARMRLTLLATAVTVTLTACSSASSPDSSLGGQGDSPGSKHPYSDGGIASGEPGHNATAPGSTDAGASNGGFGNVGTGGSRDFGAFRKALDNGTIPDPASLDSSGFFAEHYTSLPNPTCGQTFCLHGMLSVSHDLARGGDLTLLQMAMNSPVDPTTVARPPLDLAVVLDHSGSMSAAGKMDYAKQGLKLLVDALTPNDTLTLIEFDSAVSTLFGPAKVTDKSALKATIDTIEPAGGTDIYDGLEAGYKAALSVGDETQQRRVIFLTDGLATVGNTSAAAIQQMSLTYNNKYIGLTTIGLGSDADVPLLRSLSEKGGGNFYFAENPMAVTEVFTEELKFFVAPLAYDLDLRFEETSAVGVSEVFGTNLFTPAPTGGTIHVPSVFLESRTSTKPGPSGGRRGGGSAILLSLKPGSTPAATPFAVGTLHLTYRKPGSTTFETQNVDVGYDGNPFAVPAAAANGIYSAPAIEKNTIILDFFVALRDTTTKAQHDAAGAKAFLTSFQAKMQPRLQGWTDEDLLDDVKIVQQYVDVLAKSAP